MRRNGINLNIHKIEPTLCSIKQVKVRIVTSARYRIKSLLSHLATLSTVHGILQARILEWVAFPFSRGSSQSKDRIQVSRIANGFLQLNHKGSPFVLVVLENEVMIGKIKKRIQSLFYFDQSITNL